MVNIDKNASSHIYNASDRKTNVGFVIRDPENPQIPGLCGNENSSSRKTKNGIRCICLRWKLRRDNVVERLDREGLNKDASPLAFAGICSGLAGVCGAIFPAIAAICSYLLLIAAGFFLHFIQKDPPCSAARRMGGNSAVIGAIRQDFFSLERCG